jgi:GTP-binding protein HflX
LDVVIDADLLVHVVDSSAVDPFGDIDAVRTVLREIDADGVPELYVFNKADTNPVTAARLAAREDDAVAVSAVTGEGIDELLSAIGRRLRASTSVVSLVVPFDRGDALAMAHREGEVLDESSDEDGWRLRVRLDEGSVGRLAEFIAGDSGETVR